MPEEKDIRILQWPKQKALLEHYFKLDEPCPVSIIFDESPAHVQISNEAQRPFNVDMNMNLKAVDEIPICVKICEPICAKSDYSIGIELLGHPLAHIRLRGKTTIANCSDDTPRAPVCNDFSAIDRKTAKVPFTHHDVQFTPLNQATSIDFTLNGQPQNQLKMQFPNEGLRLDFGKEVNNVSLTIINFGNPVIQVNAFNNSTLVTSQSEMIENTTRKFSVNGSPLTAIEIKGGSNEAALVEFCIDEAPSTVNDPIVIVH